MNCLIVCLIKSTSRSSYQLVSSRSLRTGSSSHGMARELGFGAKKEEMGKPGTKQDWMKVASNGRSPLEARIYRIQNNDTMRSDPKEAKRIAMKKMDALKASLLVRGFARETEPYDPPEQVEATVEMIYKQVFGPKASNSWLETSLTDPIYKFKFITECGRLLNHEVPSCSLHAIERVADVVHFYQTPVRGLASYDQLLRNQDQLPVNLHLISDPIRFNPENNDYFEGQDAYPGSVDNIRGLRAQKKYPLLKKKFNWPDI